jgi:enamine deaminase RidA (YjgF/YER057c/UK114 family)
VAHPLLTCPGGGGIELEERKSSVTIEAKLSELNLTLPAAPKPIAAYVPAVRSGDLLFISGQLPLVDGQPMCEGRVPGQVEIETAQRCAGQCVLNGLAVVRDYLQGDWSKLRRIVRIGVFVQSDDGFAGQSGVANGASELLVELLGEAGRHARAAVGVNALPLNCPVEVELLVEVG